jgi:DNA-binding transcriptional ArsR family regulator
MAVETTAGDIRGMKPRRNRAGSAADAAVAPAAALLADPARVAILWALADGRALPAGELARTAGVRPSTASSHLRRLLEAGWVGAEQQGRHRYMRLVNADVAALLEALAVVGGAPARAPGLSRPLPDGLHLARSCYDHLAGSAGVRLTQALVAEGALRPEGRIYGLTDAGQNRFAALGIDAGRVVAEAKRTGRYAARACLDWSERRDHLAGALGRALLDRVLTLGWFERRRGTRALRLTTTGRRALQREFGVRLL